MRTRIGLKREKMEATMAVSPGSLFLKKINVKEIGRVVNKHDFYA